MNSRLGAGFVLGIFGAALDALSGYLILSQSIVRTDDMGVMITGVNYQGIGWSVGLLALSALIIGTSSLGVFSLGLGRMRSLGTLMEIYGAVMLVIGSLMYTGMTPMMTGTVYSSFGMFIVGALMVVNGVYMRRGKPQKMFRNGVKSDETRADLLGH